MVKQSFLLMITILGLLFFSNTLLFAVEEKDVEPVNTLQIAEQILRTTEAIAGNSIINSDKYKSLTEKEKMELKLDLMYSSEIYLPLWNAKDYESSIKIIENFQSESYKPEKMYLYEAIYYKNKGEWAVTTQLVKHTLSLMKEISEKTPEMNFLMSKALLLDALAKGDQELITEAIGLMEKVVSQKPDNLLYLMTLVNMFDYIDVPEGLYQSYEDRIVIYNEQYEILKNKILVNNQNNLIYTQEKNENYYYEEVKKPLIEDVLRRWRKIHNVQILPAELLFYFQISKDRKLIYIKRLAEHDACEKLKNVSEISIADAIVPYIPEEYPLETMDMLFIFTYQR